MLVIVCKYVIAHTIFLFVLGRQAGTLWTKHNIVLFQAKLKQCSYDNFVYSTKQNPVNIKQLSFLCFDGIKKKKISSHGKAIDVIGNYIG